MIHADSAQWSAATQALIRAVAFDGVELNRPAVRRLLAILLPVVEAELAYYEIFDIVVSRAVRNWDDLPYFPEDDGPLFLPGTGVLSQAFGAVVGEDLFDDVLGVLLPALTDAIPGLYGQVAADALTISCDDVLADLAAGGVPTERLLPVGLTMLSVLADLCRSDSASVLHRTA